MSCRALNFLDGMTGRLRTRSLYTEEYSYRYNVAELYCTASKQAGLVETQMNTLLACLLYLLY